MLLQTWDVAGHWGTEGRWNIAGGEIWQRGGILQDLQDEGSKQSETLQKGGT